MLEFYRAIDGTGGARRAARRDPPRGARPAHGLAGPAVPQGSARAAAGAGGGAGARAAARRTRRGERDHWWRRLLPHRAERAGAIPAGSPGRSEGGERISPRIGPGSGSARQIESGRDRRRTGEATPAPAMASSPATVPASHDQAITRNSVLRDLAPGPGHEDVPPGRQLRRRQSGHASGRPSSRRAPAGCRRRTDRSRGADRRGRPAARA